jgi:hypothetical protein
MKRTFTHVLCLLPAIALSLFAPPLPAQPAGYYDAADASSPAALRHSLHEIIDDHQRFPYTSEATDTWDVLELADELQGQEALSACRQARLGEISGSSHARATASLGHFFAYGQTVPSFSPALRIRR